MYEFLTGIGISLAGNTYNLSLVTLRAFYTFGAEVPAAVCPPKARFAVRVRFSRFDTDIDSSPIGSLTISALKSVASIAPLP